MTPWAHPAPMADRGLPGATTVLAASTLAALILGAGCLDAGSDAAPASSGDGEDPPEPRETNRTSETNASSTRGEPSGANTTSNATDEDEATRWNATLTGDYQTPGYPPPDTVAPTSCETDRNLGGVCFPLDATASNVTVASLEDDAFGPLPAAYVLFRDENQSIDDAEEDDGWVCPPSSPLTVPDWAAYVTVHTGDPVSTTSQSDCGVGRPASQGTVTVWVRGLEDG